MTEVFDWFQPGCRMSASAAGIWWYHSHPKGAACPLRP